MDADRTHRDAGRRSRGGFSFVELVIVLAIMGVIAAIAAPRLGNSLAHARAEAIAYQIKYDFEYAREHARTTSTSQQVVNLVMADPTYVVPGLDHPDHANEPYLVMFDRNLWGAEIVDVDLGQEGDTTPFQLIFDMYGRPDSGGTLQFRVGDHIRTIRVHDDTGRVSIER